MSTTSLKEIPFEYVECDEDFNARKDYEAIDELADSIQASGLLEPIGVVANPKKPTQYFVGYGFRRYKAICLIREKLGPEAFAEIPCVIKQCTLQDLKQLNLIENLDRKSLKPHEISNAIIGMVNSGLEQRDIAARLGRPQSWVSYHYKVGTKLNVTAAKAFEEGELTLEQALYIADVPEEEQTVLVESILSAETRTEARNLAKGASKAKGVRRTYVNKGRPSAKNLGQKIRDYSFESTSPATPVASRAFYNGVIAGMRVALGDETGELSPGEDYGDTDFDKPEERKAKAAPAKKAKGKRGRKKKAVKAAAPASAAAEASN